MVSLPGAKPGTGRDWQPWPADAARNKALPALHGRQGKPPNPALTAKTKQQARATAWPRPEAAKKKRPTILRKRDFSL